MKKIIGYLLSILMLFGLAACAPAQTPTITLSDSILTVVSGMSGTITLDTELEGEIVWKSSDVSVVDIVVNEKDARYVNIKANSTGVAIIEVTQGGAVARCSIKVVDVAIMRDAGNTLTLTLDDGYAQSNLEMKTNVSDGQNLLYYSADESIVRVFPDGKVVALKAGKTTITVRHPSGVSYVVYVDVVEA